jgi:hypothetical protein
MAQLLDPRAEAQFMKSVAYSSGFLMGESNVQQALLRICDALRADGIPHAVVGALALGQHGYRRTTEDVDLLLTRDGLTRFKQAHLGRGWVDRFPGSRGMRDTVARVDIDVIIAGEYPGDGKPKPVAFPDPAEVALRGERVSLIPLHVLIELKLASGISAPHRLRDLADVLELIRIRKLGEDFADSLDPWVQAKYLELCAVAKFAAADDASE